MTFLKALFLIFSLLIGVISEASASPIKDLDQTLYRTRKKTRTKRIVSFENRPNLAKLFSSKSPVLMEGWLGVVTKGFSPQARWTAKLEKDQLFAYYQKYLSDNNEKLSLSVYITHPAYGDMFDLGLFETLNSLEPPGLEITSAQEVDVRGRKAFLYQQKKGGCSIVLKLQHRSLFRIETASCNANQSMLDLMRRFDFTRLEEKIAS